MFFIFNSEIFLFNKLNKLMLDFMQRLWFQIPRFCYNVLLEVVGNCRMCLVELEKLIKPMASCATVLSANTSFHITSPFVKKVQEGVMEFLLNNHPLDCPICDQGGMCDLQEYSLEYGIDRNRNFQAIRRSVYDVPFDTILRMTMTRCIHCTRCVRTYQLFTNQLFLGTFGRGSSTEIGSYLEYFYKLEYMNIIINLCPVGALTFNSASFNNRNWELKDVWSITGSSSSLDVISLYYKTSAKVDGFKRNNMIKTKISTIIQKVSGMVSTLWLNLINDKDSFEYYNCTFKNPSLSQNINRIKY